MEPDDYMAVILAVLFVIFLGVMVYAFATVDCGAYAC